MDRTQVERRSAVLLAFLSTRPRVLVGVVTALVLAGAVFGPLWLATPCGLLLVAALSWLAYLGWPQLEPPGRLLRLVAIGLLTVALVLRQT